MSPVAQTDDGGLNVEGLLLTPETSAPHYSVQEIHEIQVLAVASVAGSKCSALPAPDLGQKQTQFTADVCLFFFGRSLLPNQCG